MESLRNALLSTLWGWQSSRHPVTAPSALHTSITDSGGQEPQIINMAPVELEPQYSYAQAAAGLGQVLAAVVLTVQVGRSLYHAYRGLGPAQDTRERVARRNALLPLFGGLALLSLINASYTLASYGVVSYKAWAGNHGVELPTRFYGDKGLLPPGENATPIYPIQWLGQTPVQLDAIEILAEKARRFWWGQQIELGLVSWTMLLAIEGRRRNIPLLWCYQLLGQLVSLSFAQNLFFVALLLTPAPLPPSNVGALPGSRHVRLRHRIFPPKPNNWTPPRLLSSLVLLLNFAIIYQLPYMANTPSLRHLIFAARVLSISPLLLPYLVPTTWGTIPGHHHDVYGVYKSLFRIISLLSLSLHLKVLIAGLGYNAPDAHYHRHSNYLPFDAEQRSAWERTTSAFGRILSATADHPIVSGSGWDVILSAVSVGCWAAVRATEISDILTSCLPLNKDQEGAKDDESGANELSRGKAKVSTSSGNNANAGEVVGSGSGLRRRGRSRKVKPQPDDTYEPTPSQIAETDVGDELPDAGLEWEPAAVVWALTAVGGLGVGSAGAFGGECVAR